jgi:hypothetical protein
LKKEIAMADRNLLEDEIIDLTDLLEEGKPINKEPIAAAMKKAVTEPDSFDLGRELATDLDVSIEEIEHEAVTLTPGPEKSSLEERLVEFDRADAARPKDEEALGSISSEIDLVIRDTLKEATLTKSEEELLLMETPEESPPLKPEETMEIPGGSVTVDAGARTPGPEPAAPCSAEGPAPVRDEVPRAAAPGSPVTAGEVVDAVMGEFRKDMPALLDGIVRPLVQELVREIAASTREVLPGIVEKVIREEIEKLKKLAV